MSFVICIILIFYLFIFHLITRKKIYNSILSFHSLKTIHIYFCFFKIDLSWSFDYVCCKLLYGCPSLDYRSVTLNMFAIMFFSLKINFNVMFFFWSLFYSKSVIHFYQIEITIYCLFFLSFYMMN